MLRVTYDIEFKRSCKVGVNRIYSTTYNTNQGPFMEPKAYVDDLKIVLRNYKYKKFVKRDFTDFIEFKF